MKKRIVIAKAELRIAGIEGFFKKEVTKFGTGAKIDCPKEYLKKTVYVAICAESSDTMRSKAYAHNLEESKGPR